MMPKSKKTTASDELVMVKSVRRTRSRRMKFCVQRGLGGIPQQARGAIWIATGIACRFYPEFGIILVIPKVGLSRNLIFQPVSMLISFKKFGITFPPF